MENIYIIKDGKKLRCGYTTGSCAAAAAKAAAKMLLTGERVEEVALQTPKGVLLHLLVEEITRGHDFVQCAIRKDAGDDPDVTDGVLVYAKVSLEPADIADMRKAEPADTKSDTDTAAQPGLPPGADALTNKAGTFDKKPSKNAPAGKNNKVDEKKARIRLDGGAGIGRVTRPGLYQEVGEAAINPVPRDMIFSEVSAVCGELGFTGSLLVVISIPAGVELAKKTFNPKLGIEGGISVLGTSGIVVPMSEDAIVASIKLEMQMLVGAGAGYLIITPGNYGQIFSREQLDIDLTYSMKCSNYVGETLDMAAELGVKGILFVAHIGKFIKVSGGIMNTHSKHADCRAELMAAHAIRAGASAGAVRKILASATTEESVQILKADGHLYDTMQIAADRAQEYLDRRCAEGLTTGTILFSNKEGILAQSRTVPELMQKIGRKPH